MSKWCYDSVMDAAFSLIQASLQYAVLCSGQPANYSDAMTAEFLGRIAMSAGNLTLADGSTNGRAMSLEAMASCPVSVAGSIGHVALVGSTTLFFVTTTTSKAVGIGDAVNIPAWRDTIADPS